jgi:uncharacterized protein YyaL (SSP411 family)
MRNVLGEASSPYLQQHKDNPVHWQVWGEEALAEAKRLNRPVLLSVGYAACHWCHVMAHESFENPAVAKIMNENFVNIKVDREERPDIDQIYLSALNAMGEQGGWPLTMVLTPKGEPFWGGTYFPPTPRFGRPSFSQVLLALSRAWSEDQARIGDTVAAMNRALAAQAAANPGAVPGQDVLAAVGGAFLHSVDWELGGFSGAPKFPNIPVFRFLWQESFRAHDARAGEAVELVLTRMGQGGIYDHLGGGFARYATDEAWLIPHFEKMLYDNALILDLLALVYAKTCNPLYAARARETVEWLTRDMREEGAFAASEDADSEGEEGKFYVWSAAEINEVLVLDAPFFAQHYPVPEHGNWEGKIIFERLTALGDDETEARLAVCRAKLLARRAKRVRPARDDKVLADWNALAVAALARASAAFEEPGWLQLAEEVFDFILSRMGQADGRIAHAYRSGKISAAGLLEDQAAMLRAALALYQARGDEARLAQGLRILKATEQNFADGEGAFYMSAVDAADVFTPRVRNAQDGPTHSGIGLMEKNYALLYHLTGEAAYRAKAEALLAAYGGRTERLAASPTLLSGADILENATCVVASEALAHAALAAPDPTVVVLRTGATLPPEHPAYGKAVDKQAAWVCHAGVCKPPVSTVSELYSMLRQPGPKQKCDVD